MTSHAHLWLVAALAASPATLQAAEPSEPSPADLAAADDTQIAYRGPIVTRQEILTPGKEGEEPQALGLEFALTVDAFKNLGGGLSTGSRATANADVIVSVDTDAAGWWPGGTFQLYLLGNAGGTPGALAGETQLISNIEAPGTVKVFEAWYEHKWLDGRARLKAGLIDFNVDFYTLEAAEPFVNSSFGIPPDLGQVGVSAFPTTGPAASLHWEPGNGLYVQGFVADGVPGDPDNPYGTQISLKGDDGVFMALELGYGFAATEALDPHPSMREEVRETLEHGAEPLGGPLLPMKLAVGLWRRTTDFTDFQGVDRSDATGWYGMGEYWFGDKFAVFAKFGKAPGERLPTEWFASAGLNWKGPLPGREEDVLALGVAQNRWSDEYLDLNPGFRRSETVVELTYLVPLTDHITVQPDIQWVHNPSGDPALEDAVVVGARLSLSF